MPKREKQPPDPDKLQREKAGAYRTGDGRFEVSSQGSEWFVTDTERVDGFGLELVIGPLGTLADAKQTLARQRDEPQGHTIDERADLAKQAAAAIERGDVRGRRKSDQGPASRPEKTPARKPPAPAPPKGLKPAEKVALARWRKRGDERDAVAAVVRAINDAWTRGRPDRAGSGLHPDVVFVPPGFSGETEGRDAVVDSYREFMTDAVIHRYAESDLDIRVWDASAVATYRWEMDWEQDGDRHDERGRDVFVLERVKDRWLAVWRLLQLEEGEAGGRDAP